MQTRLPRGKTACRPISAFSNDWTPSETTGSCNPQLSCSGGQGGGFGAFPAVAVGVSSRWSCATAFDGAPGVHAWEIANTAMRSACARLLRRWDRREGINLPDQASEIDVDIVG